MPTSPPAEATMLGVTRLAKILDRLLSDFADWGMAMTTSEYRYEIVLYWSEPDEAFIAEVPELPGCAADGSTYQDALEAVGVAMREWVETAKELGRPIPDPKERLRTV